MEGTTAAAIACASICMEQLLVAVELTEALPMSGTTASELLEQGSASPASCWGAGHDSAMGSSVAADSESEGCRHADSCGTTWVSLQRAGADAC